MNRTVKEAAQVLGIRENALRAWLRTAGVLNKAGALAARHHGRGNFYMDARSCQPARLGHRKHYAVLKVTEKGIDWVAKHMGIQITDTTKKDTAA